ncbi:MAG TPA: glycine zipper domain-containing protein [Candidatus Omnitrophota bacterium]|nr:glycine zipper domain-containing protein [Candidatus Omnitrophota bacterium]
MKRTMTMLVLSVLVAGCTTTQKGTAIGTAAGAGLGAIIGHQSGNRDKGALIGGAVGAAGGYVVGNKMEQKKFCPTCGKVFSEDKIYCPFDGAELKFQQK